MSLIAAPLPDYNSFVSPEAALAFHTDRQTAAWLAADDTARQAALIRATDYISNTFTFSIDPLEGDIVNPALTVATMMLAVHTLTDDLNEQRLDRDIIEQETELTGTGRERIRYSTNNGDRFPLITKVLSPIASRNGGDGAAFFATVVR